MQNSVVGRWDFTPEKCRRLPGIFSPKVTSLGWDLGRKKCRYALGFVTPKPRSGGWDGTMNTAHTFLTLIMLFFLPEFKLWFCDKIQTKWLIPSALMFTLIGIGAYLSAAHVKTNYEGLAFFFIILVMFDNTHALAQIKGLSLMYNQTIQPALSENEKSKQVVVEKRERVLFDSFLFLIVLQLLLTQIFSIPRDALKWFYLTSSMILFASIVLNSFAYPQIKRSNKRFYLLSGIFSAFAAYFPVAFVLQKSLHGLEYCFLSYGISKRSSVKMAWQTGFEISLSIVFLYIVSVPAVTNFPLPAYLVPRNLRFSIFFFGFFLKFFHYYMDSQMFKFRDPLVRARLARAIIPELDLAP